MASEQEQRCSQGGGEGSERRDMEAGVKARKHGEHFLTRPPSLPSLPPRSLMRGLGSQWPVYVGITVRLGCRPPWDHRGEIWGNRGIRARNAR